MSNGKQFLRRGQGRRDPPPSASLRRHLRVFVAVSPLFFLRPRGEVMDSSAFARKFGWWGILAVLEFGFLGGALFTILK